MSINRNASAITERVADFILFDQTRTGGVIGTATVSQENNGYAEPNVQAAIDDLWDKALLPVGSVVITPVNRDPGTTPSTLLSQRVAVTVSGSVAANGNITVAGVSVAVLTTDTPTSVATKIAAALSSQTFISSASSSGAVVTYEYADTGVHPLATTSQNGLTLTSVVQQYGGVTGYYGYGSWEYLGTETKFSKSLYYWLRVA